jgi:hypothetical protein
VHLPVYAFNPEKKSNISPFILLYIHNPRYKENDCGTYNCVGVPDCVVLKQYISLELSCGRLEICISYYYGTCLLVMRINIKEIWAVKPPS